MITFWVIYYIIGLLTSFDFFPSAGADRFILAVFWPIWAISLTIDRNRKP